MKILHHFSRTGLALAALVVLAGCASLSPDGGAQEITAASAPSLSALGVPKAQIATAPTAQTQEAGRPRVRLRRTRALRDG